MTLTNTLLPYSAPQSSGGTESPEVPADLVARLDRMDVNITAEKTAREAAEKTIQDDLDKEVTDRDTAVTAEKTAREAADKTLTDSITKEVTDRGTAVTAEETARKAADKTLTDNLAQEVTNRGTAITAESTARTAAIKVVADKVTANETSIATINTTLTTRKTEIDALDTRIDALELSVSLGNERFALEDGLLYVAHEAIELATFVHRRTDGKIEVAMDNSSDKPANGYVPAPVAAGATTKVYGDGAKYTFSAMGGVGAVSGASDVFLGENGKISASNAPKVTGRFIQRVGVMINGVVYLGIDSGVWVAPL